MSLVDFPAADEGAAELSAAMMAAAVEGFTLSAQRGGSLGRPALPSDQNTEAFSKGSRQRQVLPRLRIDLPERRLQGMSTERRHQVGLLDTAHSTRGWRGMGALSIRLYVK